MKCIDKTLCHFYSWKCVVCTGKNVGINDRNMYLNLKRSILVDAIMSLLSRIHFFSDIIL